MSGAGPPAWHRWIDAEPRPGWLNMACDSALLGRAAHDGECWLRLYAWSPACLSFGRHEPASTAIDRRRLAGTGLDAVRRPTGGGMVVHADELTYAVAAPIAVLGGLREAYGRIHTMLTDALFTLGITAVAAPRPTRPIAPGNGACFGSTAGGELLIGGAKAVGSAQLRQGNALLQHGSILLAGTQNVVAEIATATHPSPVTASLGRALGRVVGPGEVARVIATAAERAWNATWHEADSAAIETLLVEACRHGQHFRSSEWTWGR